MSSELDAADFDQLAAIYSLLSRLWLEEIDLKLLAALSDQELKTAYENLGGKLPEKIDNSVVDELAVDYCQILIGPQGQISPVQSVWENQALQSSAASSTREYFKYLPDFEPPSNIVDHIGVQLQFMAELFQGAADEDNRGLVIQIADDFFKNHLSWTAPFLIAVAEKAETDFYVGLANLTANFLNLKPSEY